MTAHQPIPLIAVTGARSTGGAWGRYSLGHFMDYLLSDYSQALLHAGAAAVIVPAAQDAASLGAILDRVQGLILSGGPDVHPRRYGEEPIAALGEIDAVLDDMELTAARMAVDRDLPVLGICRGMQLLNVARGGTLIQHLPESHGHDGHRPNPGSFDGSEHGVRLADGSLAARAVGETLHVTKQHHHQAVDELGRDLEISGWSVLDELPEAVELPGRRFVLGVQWHPEVDPDSELIGRFVAACREAAGQ